MEQLQALKDLISEDFLLLDNKIQTDLYSDAPYIQDITSHILINKGKQIRPLVVMLISKSIGYTGQKHINLAMIIEALHIAMLVHDDVVDNSLLRRGNITVNYKWDNPTSVLMGDFIYSRAFQLMINLESPAILSVLSSATNYIAEGELMQLQHRNKILLSVTDYLEIIKRKTAKLFEVSVSTALLLAEMPKDDIALIKQYGLNLGMAFQIIDDVLDYSANSSILGKKIGDDLRQGNTTLLIIYAISQLSGVEKQNFIDALTNKDESKLIFIQDVLEKVAAARYCTNLAQEYVNKAQQALVTLPNNQYKEALLRLSDLVISRNY